MFDETLSRAEASDGVSNDQSFDLEDWLIARLRNRRNVSLFFNPSKMILPISPDFMRQVFVMGLSAVMIEQCSIIRTCLAVLESILANGHFAAFRHCSRDTLSSMFDSG